MTRGLPSEAVLRYRTGAGQAANPGTSPPETPTSQVPFGTAASDSNSISASLPSSLSNACLVLLHVVCIPSDYLISIPTYSHQPCYLPSCASPDNIFSSERHPSPPSARYEEHNKH
ncbi:unnamed protein product [Pleuronectes platessa]|uniref:Uncharacterized protein n=1 Tax=Pleuronectes platessa TaxID=8262 RepID=A0A9N7UZZ0_PLEPL|nr:unnamed protein product [Pleuronectes platessa]